MNMETIVNFLKYHKTDRARSRSPPRDEQDSEMSNSNSNGFDRSMWSHVPYIFMVDVAGYLSDRERANVSQVCKNWRAVMQDSSLWRAKGFLFGGPKSQGYGVKAIKFVKQHGSALKHVSLQCVYNPAYVNESITQTLKRFLNLLRCARLLTFRMECAELNGRWECELYRSKLALWVSNFLQSQGALKMFGMMYSLFQMSSGVRMLESLAAVTSEKLQCLELVAYFAFGLNASQFKPYVDAVTGFRQLVVVHLSYSYINEDILLAWAEQGTLTNLHLLLHRTDPHDHIISNETWRQVKSQCVDLVVFYSILDLYETDKLIPILQHSVPLGRLVIKLSENFEGGLPMRREQQLAYVLQHVSIHYPRCLYELVLDLVNGQHDPLDNALVSVVTSCKALRKLSVTACLADRVWQVIDRFKEQPNAMVQTSHIDQRQYRIPTL